MWGLKIEEKWRDRVGRGSAEKKLVKKLYSAEALSMRARLNEWNTLSIGLRTAEFFCKV